MVLHVEPGRLRHAGDRPTAVTGVGIAGPPRGYRTGDVLLGVPTCSARTRRGFWGLYADGADVVVVHPGGAMIGPPALVAGDLDRLHGAGQDEFTSAAVRAILAFLTGPDTIDTRMPTGRTWSNPAKGYWLSGPYNEPGHAGGQPPSWPGAPARPSAPRPGPLPAVRRPATPSRPAPPQAA